MDSHITSFCASLTIDLCSFNSDSQADDAQEAYRLAVQAADDILLAGAVCIECRNLSDILAFLSESACHIKTHCSMQTHSLTHLSLSSSII